MNSHPTPSRIALCATRADPPPPGEGKGASRSLTSSYAMALMLRVTIDPQHERKCECVQGDDERQLGKWLIPEGEAERLKARRREGKRCPDGLPSGVIAGL
jgi:hypothetical protein